jgi:hypothetical protein
LFFNRAAGVKRVLSASGLRRIVVSTLVGRHWRKEKTIYRGLDYGFQFWLGASFVSGKRINWVEAQGQGGQRIFIVPTLDLVTVVTAGNYYGNDHLANLVPQIVFDDYVLPAVDAKR